MSIRDALLIAASGLAMASDVVFAAESPNLGRVATPDEIAPWDISIGPDGVGLPPGSGTPKQGETVYAAKCFACHGEKGAGKPNYQLVGGKGSLPDCGRAATGSQHANVRPAARRRQSAGTCTFILSAFVDFKMKYIIQRPQFEFF